MSIPIITFVIHLAVNCWLLVILWRRDLWRMLPWFYFYIASEFVTTSVALTLWCINPRLYVTVYWWMEPVVIGLMVGAVRESFLGTFVGFSSLRWFPWVVTSVIAGVLVYSTWKAIYAPPVQSNRAISFIIAGEFTFRWGIVAIALLSLLMVRMLELPNDSREVVVMGGCAIASAAFLVTVLSRSFFGEKYTWIMQYIPELGYLMAITIWIKYMLRPELEFGFKELGITPEQMAAELRRYQETAERLLKAPKVPRER
jgi:hypothetical protein